jgi:hypothetical protein
MFCAEEDDMVEVAVLMIWSLSRDQLCLIENRFLENSVRSKNECSAGDWEVSVVRVYSCVKREQKARTKAVAKVPNAISEIRGNPSCKAKISG